jgi:hypothetical protein
MIRIKNIHTGGIFLADGTLVPPGGFVDLPDSSADMVAVSGPMLGSVLELVESEAEAPKPQKPPKQPKS